MRWGLVVGWLACCAPAVGLFALVERSNHRKAEFVRLAEGRAEGVIVRIEKVSGTHLKLVPVVAFDTREGRKVEFRSRYYDLFSIQPHRYSVDQRVPVVFVPSDPQRAEMDEADLHEPDALPLRTGSLAWMGAMSLIFGGIAVFLATRRPRRAS